MTFLKKLTSLILCNRFSRQFRNYLDNDEIDIHQRVLTMSIVICVVGGLISVIISFLVETNPTANVLSDIIGLPVGFTNLIIVIVLLLGVLTIALSIWKGTIQIPALVFIIMSIVVFLPLMFFNDGGICGGVVPWFVLTISLSPLLLIGGKRFFMYAIGILSFAFCILVSFLHPELVLQNETQLETYVDIFQCVVIVAVIISCIYRFKTYAFDRQHKRLEEREKELEAAVEETRNANAAKSAFLARMSHEIRTPINAVLGMNELILRENSSPDIAGYAENIRRSGTSLLSIINDILDISKIESGKIELTPSDYCLAEVISDCISMIYPRLTEKNLKLEINADEITPAQLYGDLVRIRQIISNILTNAVKYTNTGTITFSVSANRRDETTADIIISVKDTGIGIKEEDLPLIFDTFHRFDEKHTASIEGTGLGLSITRQLVELMGGSISVKSTIRAGSEFTVIIPQKITGPNCINACLSVASIKAGFDHPAPAGSYIPCFISPETHLLAVDDVAVNLEVIKGLLKKTQIQIDTAANGYDAIELIRKNRYDIIFLDDRMPGLTGTETLAKIRSEHLLPKDTPVIVVTANALMGEKEKYLAAGFDGYLSKPIWSFELESLLRRFIKPAQNQTPVVIPAADHNTSENRKAADTITLSEKIPGIDRTVAERFCGKDTAIYRELLSVFLSDQRLASLEKLYTEKNTKDYRTEIHGLKSAAKTIGAVSLSDNAQALESAAKADDWDCIRQHHDQTMQEYKTLLADIQTYINGRTINGEKP